MNIFFFKLLALLVLYVQQDVIFMWQLPQVKKIEN